MGEPQAQRRATTSVAARNLRADRSKLLSFFRPDPPPPGGLAPARASAPDPFQGRPVRAPNRTEFPPTGGSSGSASLGVAPSGVVSSLASPRSAELRPSLPRLHVRSLWRPLLSGSGRCRRPQLVQASCGDGMNRPLRRLPGNQPGPTTAALAPHRKGSQSGPPWIRRAAPTLSGLPLGKPLSSLAESGSGVRPPGPPGRDHQDLACRGLRTTSDRASQPSDQPLAGIHEFSRTRPGSGKAMVTAEPTPPGSGLASYEASVEL